MDSTPRRNDSSSAPCADGRPRCPWRSESASSYLPYRPAPSDSLFEVLFGGVNMMTLDINACPLAGCPPGGGVRLAPTLAVADIVTDGISVYWSGDAGARWRLPS